MVFSYKFINYFYFDNISSINLRITDRIFNNSPLITDTTKYNGTKLKLLMMSEIWLPNLNPAKA